MKHSQRHGGLARGLFGPALAMVVIAGSCTTRPSRDARAGSPAGLDAIVERQRSRPEPLGLAFPPELGISEVDPSDAEARARAMMTLDAACEQLLPALSPPAPASAPDEAGATSLYAQGRGKLFEGNVPSAIADLTNATKLDPTAGEPWRELGEAHAMAGARALAISAYAKALACGLRDPVVAERLGRDALERGDVRAAAGWLALAWRDAREHSDPILSFVVGAELGEALSELGYHSASGEALAHALRAPDRAPAPTRFLAEQASLSRRRADLWMGVGDAALRVGDSARASDAYERSAGIEQRFEATSAALTPRRAVVLARLGRPAEAARLVLDEVASGRVSADDRVLGVSRFLASSVGEEFDQAARAWLESDPPPTPSSARSLTRLRAAIAEPEAAAAALREHLARDPSDAAVLKDLVSLLKDRTDAELARGLVPMAHAAPDTADRLAREISRCGRARSSMIAELEGVDGGGASLLRGWLCLQSQRFDAVVGTLEPALRDPRTRTAGLALRARALAGLGRYADADADIAAIGSAPEAALARAGALSASQRFAEALDALGPRLASAGSESPVRAEEALLAADAAIAIGAVLDAERWLSAAAGADPADERPVEALLNLYAPRGPAPDAAKLAQAVRLMRALSPASRLSTLLRGQELGQRGLWPQAIAELRPLAEADPHDELAVDLLVSLWERAASPSEPTAWTAIAEEWIRLELAKHPEAPPLHTQLARVLSASGRGEEAAALLQSRLAEEPLVEYSRARELVLREVLDRAAEADAETQARLDVPTPTIDARVERAELASRQGRLADAAAELSAALPPGSAFTLDQRQRVVSLVGRAVIPAADQPEPELEASGRLIQIALDADGRLPAPVHERRLVYLVQVVDATDAALLDAALLAEQQVPQLQGAGRVRVAALLAEHRSPRRAMDFLASAAPSPGRAHEEPFVAWIRLIAEHGEVSDARRLVEAAAASGMIEKLATRLQANTGPESTNARAELAYGIASITTSLRSAADAIPFYRHALEIEPTHPMACNDLGYFLAEADIDVSEAARLLEVAYAARPTSESVIDSLAWVRYKQGILVDQELADGSMVLGAVSLLREAAKTKGGRENATILDHLGDALWVSGERDEAIKTWEQAGFQARRQLAGAREQGQPDTVLQRLGEELERIRSKRSEAAAGREPAVAPHGPIVSPPAEPGASEPSGS